MAWIKTIPLEEADESLRTILQAQHALYPAEYSSPVAAADNGAPGIVAAHSLIPEALRHSFATFGALMSPELPLERRQHELIATVVSITNRCRY